MKFATDQSTAPEATVTDAANSCCLRRAEMEWATDDIVIGVMHGRPIATDAIDRLPPWRAVAYVQFAMQLPGAQMEHGDLDQLLESARKAGGYARPGWWRAELGLPAAEPRTTAAERRAEYVPPAGWKVVHPPNGGPT